MIAWPDRAAIRSLHACMEIIAQRVRLPLRNHVWRGETGNWSGAGVGSSIDFQDHRPYLPGDDPRYIDWQAYARSGHYTMKLFREEVSPRVDVVLDVSVSMAFEKATRSLELFYFAIESALQSGASLRCYALAAERAIPLQLDAVLSNDLPLPSRIAAPVLDQVPWRQGSLRVWVSDLLFPGSPEPFLTSLVAAKGRGVILAPYARGESTPNWSGNMELLDCESESRRLQHVTPELLARYKESYERHFEMWIASGRRQAVPVMRIPAELDFQEALQADALRSGAIEMVA